MKRRWLLGFLGGGLCALLWGGATASLPQQEPLDALSLGMFTTLLLWVPLWLWVMATERLGRSALIIAALSLLGLALCAWGFMG